jgi:NAD(P)-dependent dehydrogenase (short-subunit alcohol dehydrogenase family)
MKLDSSISAIVTGGASGLGGATVRALRAKGVKVAIFDMNEKTGVPSPPKPARSTATSNVTNDARSTPALPSPRRQRPGAHPRQLRRHRQRLQNRQPQQGDRRDPSHSRSTFDRIIQINLVGTFRCIAKSAAGMLTLDVLPDGERGAIVNTASVAAEDGQIGQAAYSASKGGVIGMTLPIARDLSTESIRVNTILPGHLQHPAPRRRPGEREGRARRHRASTPSAWAIPSNTRSLALQMIENGYFNGESVRLDGGIRMAPR